MPTLGTLCDEPDFCLRFADGGPTSDRVVDSVRVVSMTSAAGSRLGDVRDALVVIGDYWVSDREAIHDGVELLLRELSRKRVAGLAVVVPRHGVRNVPVAIRSSAARLDVPLLTTTKALRAWHELIPRLREYRYRHAEWHADQLTALLNRLPDRLADADAGAMERIADWLAAAVEGDVLVSDPQRGVLAAAPETAPGALAPLLAQQAARPAAEPASPHTRSVPLASAGSAAVLSVRARRPFDDVGTDLVRHAAKALGLIEQARLRHPLAEAQRGVHLSVLQLLMVGEEMAAQRVMAGLAPGLLATEPYASW
jgi:hypothetical protein